MEQEKGVIAVIFGGQSSEHEISCMSVCNVVSNIDTELWDIILIGITKEGHWVKVDSLASIEDGSWVDSEYTAEISPDATKGCVIVTTPEDTIAEIPIDVAWPVLHGKYGEDGTIQGLLELAAIPYVGCGVLCSAVSMDKFYTKIIVNSIGIRQARFEGVRASELIYSDTFEAALDRVESKISYPIFVKPSKAGSSCGVSKASNREELAEALNVAAEVDTKILCEEFIKGREVECAVFCDGSASEIEASGVGEVLAAADFYDYDAKYNNPDSKTVIDPDLPAEITEEIRTSAKRIFEALDGYGLSRVDFFVAEGNQVIFNEINTMPGFTAISMYPMLWEARGISKKELVAKLIESAYEREE